MNNETNPPQVKPKKKGLNQAQKKFLIGSLILVGAITYLIYSAIDTSANYYYKVAEVKAMGSRAMNMALRLEGKVAPGTIANDAANLKLRFEVVDDSKASIRVYYEGMAPDMLQDDIDVVVEGSLDSSGQLVATRVLTSCPSRYDAAEEAKEAKESEKSI